MATKLGIPEDNTQVSYEVGNDRARFSIGVVN
jgi:hypothetical protein